MLAAAMPGWRTLLNADPLGGHVNWDAIGAIAESLGALGVIGSLVYLAFQIRTNTRAVKVTSYQTNSAAYRELNLALIANPELLERISGPNAPPIIDLQAARIRGVLLNYFQTLHYQYEQGFLDADLWVAHLETMRTIVTGDDFQAWLSSGVPISLRPDFRRLVENLARE